MANNAVTWTPVAVSASTEAVEYIAGKEDQQFFKSIVMLAGNGTTDFGKIKAGTPICMVTASKKYRPAFKATANGAGVAATTLDFNEDLTGALYAGDTLYFATQADTQTVDSVTDVNTVELSAGHTWDDAEVIYLNGTEGADGELGSASGFLRHTIHSFSHVDEDGLVVHLDKPGVLHYRGAVVEANLTNWDDSGNAFRTTLKGHISFV